MKKYRLIIAWVILLEAVSSFGQPVIIWDKVLGSYDYDNGQSIVAMDDGGCVFSAWPYEGGNGDVPTTRGSRDVWGGRLDANGNLLWSKIFGGSKEDIAGPVWKTDDEGIIFQYSTASDDYDIPERIGGAYDQVFHKVNAKGQTEWVKLFGCTDSELGYGRQIENGNYLMHLNFGKNDGSLSDLPEDVRSAVIEFDQQANPLWKAHVSLQWDQGENFHTNVLPTSDGGFIFGVNMKNNPNNQGGTDLCIWRFSGKKKLLWKKCHGGKKDDFNREILELPDGGFVIAGNTYSKNWHITNPQEDLDVLLLVLDAEGNLVSQKAYGGSRDEFVKRMLLAENGKSVILLCNTYSDDGDVSYHHGYSSDIWLLKVDIATNKIVWEKTYGSGNGGEYAEDMTYSPDGSLFVLGETSGSQNGDVTGKVQSIVGPDLWIFKLAPEEVKAPDDCGTFIISPNLVLGNTLKITFPNLLKTNPDIRVFDSRGALVVYYPDVPMQNNWQTNLELPPGLPAGVYFVQMRGCNTTPQVGKFVKIR